MLSLDRVSLDGFGIEPALNRDRLRLKLTGTGDMIAVSALQACLVAAHEEVKTRGLAAVEIDIRSLYLLNSSCLKVMLHFIHDIQTQGPPYRVEFVTDPRLTWQRRALTPFVRLAPEVASIVES